MRVLLSGYYGFGNLGDEAILAGLGAALQRRGHEPLVLSNDPADTERRHSFEARHRVSGLVGALTSVDAVVSGGGGLLQDATSARSLIYYLSVLRLARLLGRRTAVYAQSLGPLSERGRRRVGAALRGVPLFLRDRTSIALAREFGLDAELVGDAALLLPARSTDAGTSLAASALERPAGENHQRRIVLIPRGGHDAYNDALIELARRLEAARLPLAVMVLHPVEDLAPAERLVGAAPGTQTWLPPTPAKTIEQLATASVVVSARLHGCILAALAGTSFIGLAYDPKVAGFLEQVGATGFVAPIDPAALLAAVREPRVPSAAAVADLVSSANAGVDSLLAALE